MSTQTSLGYLLRFYKRTLPAKGIKPINHNNGEKFLMTLGYYDAISIKRIKSMEECGSPDHKGDPDDTQENWESQGGLALHQQTVLLAERDPVLDKELEFDDGFFAVSFFNMEDDQKTERQWHTPEIERELDRLSSSISGWPLSIHVYLTTGTNAIAAVIQTDLGGDMVSDSPFQTFPSKVLALLRVIRECDGAVCGTATSRLADSYTIFGFGLTNNLSEKERRQKISWRLQVRTKACVSPEYFRKLLIRKIREVSKENPEYADAPHTESVHYLPGMNDYSICFHSIPFEIMRSMYLESGFIIGCGDKPNPAGADIISYGDNFFTEILDEKGNSDILDKVIQAYKKEIGRYDQNPCGENRSSLHWNLKEFKRTKELFEIVKLLYPTLYSAVLETVNNYEQNITLLSERWIDTLYTPILQNLMIQVRNESIFRYAWGRPAPDPGRFIDQFERTLLHVMHSNAYNTNTKGYHLSQYTFMPRLLTGYTALINKMAYAYENDEKLHVEKFVNRFLCTAHAAHCSGVSSSSAIRDSTGPFGICVNVWMPRELLYKPVEILGLLMHEAGHNIAPRLRKPRTNCLLHLSLNMALYWLAGFWNNEEQFVPMTYDRYVKKDEAEKPCKFLLCTLAYFREQMYEEYENAYKTKMGAVQETTREKIKELEANYGLHDYSIGQIIGKTCDAEEAYGSFVHKYMNEALDALLSDEIYWTNRIYSYLRSNIMDLSKDLDMDLANMEDIINMLVKNWNYLLQFQSNERRLASRCLYILADITSDLYMINVLDMSVGQYLRLQQDYNISKDKLSKEEYQNRMETPSINLRILTVLNKKYHLENSSGWKKEYEEHVHPDFMHYVKAAYDQYLYLLDQKNLCKNGNGLGGGKADLSKLDLERLEIVYSYFIVGEYAQELQIELTSGKFLNCPEVKEWQRIYQKALKIEEARSRKEDAAQAEHEFYVDLLQLNFTTSIPLASCNLD